MDDMDFFTLLLLALGLAADAFAVSITNGICSNHMGDRPDNPQATHRKYAFLTGITFGLFQALMPVIGYYLGKAFFEFVHRYQHWAALFLLGAIGINMLIDSVKERHNPEIPRKRTVFTVKNLVIQGAATSIDAMAAGVSFAVLDTSILTPALLIGLITFIFCFIGVYIGKIFGTVLGNRARFIGGVILICIGIKTFMEAYL
jgi:manganese efflux pump family protein